MCGAIRGAPTGAPFVRPAIISNAKRFLFWTLAITRLGNAYEKAQEWAMDHGT